MSLTKRWVVYLHENRVNGKKYIGITCQKLNQRWHNGEGYKQSSRFYSAIQHYGWDGFRHEVLYEDLTREQAEALEIELIAKYDTMNPDKGYNLTTGGSTPTVTEETKRKQREAKLGHAVSAETREKLRKAKKGQPLSEAHLQGIRTAAEARRGKKRPPDVGAKVSASKKGRPLSAEHCAALRRAHPTKPVICLDTQAVYVSANEAGRVLGFDGRHVSECCNRKSRRRTAGGYRWAYYDTESGRALEVKRDDTTHRPGFKFAVRCVETDEVYESAAEAQRQTGINYNTIGQCCAKRQGRKTAGGYHWEYFDTPIFDTQDFCRKEVKENDRQV